MKDSATVEDFVAWFSGAWREQVEAVLDAEVAQARSGFIGRCYATHPLQMKEIPREGDSPGSSPSHLSSQWFTWRRGSPGERAGSWQGREGPLLEEVAEAYDVLGQCACNRLVLTALRLAQKRGWEFIRIRIKERLHRKRLKKLLNEETQPADEILGEFYRLASTFQEVAIRSVPRGNDLECRYLAREAIGLPRQKSNSHSSDLWAERLYEEEFEEPHIEEPRWCDEGEVSHQDAEIPF